MSWNNGKVVGAGVSYEEYAQQAEGVKRGDKTWRVSRSDLADVLACPYKWREGAADESSDAMLWGSLIDMLLLTPERFGDRFAVCPETYMAEGKKKGDPQEEKPWNWNATVCKNWRDEQGGKETIKSELHEAAKEAVKRFKENPLVFALLAGFQAQTCVEACWADEATRLVIPVRGLIDIVPSKTSANSADLADLKTTVDASMHTWGRKVFSGGYHVQAALYLDLYNAATGEDRTSFLHLVQEKESPYAIGTRRLDPAYIVMGRGYYEWALRVYAKCLATGTWPGYDDNKWTLIEPEPWMSMYAPAEANAGGKAPEWAQAQEVTP
jgi:exodeoxyribonuclease VIII